MITPVLYEVFSDFLHIQEILQKWQTRRQQTLSHPTSKIGSHTELLRKLQGIIWRILPRSAPCIPHRPIRRSVSSVHCAGRLDIQGILQIKKCAEKLFFYDSALQFWLIWDKKPLGGARITKGQVVSTHQKSSILDEFRALRKKVFE